MKIFLMCLFVILCVITNMHIQTTKNWSENDLNIFYKYYQTETKENILKLLPNRNWHSLEEFARRHGLKRDKAIFGFRKGTLKPLLSENLQTYYWNGYLMADGYFNDKLNQVVLSSVKKDEEQMNIFARFLGLKKCSVYKLKGNSYKSVEGFQCRVSVAEKGIYQQICDKFGFKQLKTYNPPDINILNRTLNTKEKFMAFFVGLVDGDGSVFITKYNNKNRLSIEMHGSWVYFLNWINDKLYQYEFRKNGLNANIGKRGYAKISLTNQDSLKKIKTFIVDNKLIVLDRKWNKI